MSGGSSANNSWTILTPEETVAETLRPLVEGPEHHEESLTSAAGPGENQLPQSAEGPPVEGHLVSEEKAAELSADMSTDQHASVPTAITDAPVPTSLEVLGSFAPGNDALNQSEGLPEGPAQFSPDPDSFSDAHITPSPDESTSTPLSTETLGGVEFIQQEETLAQEGPLQPLNGEGLQEEGEESDLSHGTTDVGKQADSPLDSEVGQDTIEKTGEEGEPEVRRRRSLLAALERIGRTEEEEEGEEEFQLPQREGDSGFSVNKCILGAVILLGLGTIFLSGVFMDLEEESDYGTRELKDGELPGKQEWLNPEVPPPPVDSDSTELLNKLAKENQQISVLQAQLQAQKEELKLAKGQAADRAKEQLRWEEVEKENSRLKKEMASLPVLQKENEKMKRELESVPTLQKEVETLRSTLTELKLSSASEATPAPVKPTTAPSSGHPEDSTQGTAGTTETQPRKTWGDQGEKKKDMKKIKNDLGERVWKESEKSEWKEGEKRQRKDGGDTERKKGKHVKSDKEKDEEGMQKSYETKQRKEKDWKKEKVSRGDEGKPWKDREDVKEWIVQSERKGWKEEKDWKKAKHEKGNEGKQWKGKEEKKDWRVGKDHSERHKGREEWKGEKEWKKGKDGYKESGKEKWEKKDWKEKGEKKEWKKVDRNSKDHSKEGKWKGERKQWEESKDHAKERKVKDERKQWNEREWKNKNGKHDKDWKKKDEAKQLNENEWKNKNGKHDKEWKRKDEAKQLNENEWKNKNGKHDKEWKRKDEAKQLNENEWKNKNGKHDKEWKRKDEAKQLNENEWKNKNGKHDKEWKRKDERKHWEKKEEQGKKGGQKEIKDWNKDRSQKHKDEHKYTGNHDYKEEHRWGERKPPHTHRRLSAEQPEYWVHQRGRFQHSPKPPQHCNSLETCAQAEGLLPVPFPEFEAVLQTYLAKAAEMGVDASIREELKKLTTEFFKDGVFVHDQMSFQDFAEDLGDVLEDMVEGDDSDDEEDSAIEQEMEAFEKEVMKKFSVMGAGEKEERAKGEWRKESGRGRG